MSAEAKVTMSAESQQLMQTLASVQKGFDKLTDTLVKQEEQSKKGNAAAVDGLGRIENAVKSSVRELASMATGWLSISGAVRLVTGEIEKYTQRMASAASVNNTFASALAAATRNAPAGFGGGQIQSMAESAAAASGLSPTAVAGAMPGMFAAGGAGLNASQYQSILQSAGPVAFGNAQEYQSTAAAAASFMSQTGGAISAQQSIGFLQTAAGGSAVESFANYSPLVGSVAASALAMGLDPSQSIAMFNATTRGTNDVTGSSSRTATIQYMSALAQARKDLGLPNNATPQQIIAALRDPKNARYREKWEADLKAEASHKAFLQSVTGGGIGSQFFSEGFQSTPTFEGAQSAYNSMAANVASIPAVQNAMIAQTIGGATEQNYIAQGEAGAVREAIQGYMASSPSMALGDAFDMAAFDASVLTGADPSQAAIKRLRSRARSLRAPQQYYQGEGLYAELPASDENISRAQVIEHLIAILERLDATFSQLNTTPPVTTNGDRQGAPSVTPPMPNTAAVGTVR